MSSTLSKLLLLAILGAVPIGDLMAHAVPAKTEKQGYVEPLQMFDNLFYIGDKWTSAYLLVTEQGLVVIDTLDMPYSKWLPDNIRKLGFNPQDVKYLLITHPHSDHVAGAGFLQSLLQAKVVMSSQGMNLLSAQSVKYNFTMPTINWSPADKDSLTLGDNYINFYQTPGHAEGCMSFTFEVRDKGKTYKALVVCGNGTNFTGKLLAANYVKSVNTLKRLVEQDQSIQINLATHPHLAQLFERKEQQNPAQVNAFVDRKGLLGFLLMLEQRGQLKLKQELTR